MNASLYGIYARTEGVHAMALLPEKAAKVRNNHVANVMKHQSHIRVLLSFFSSPSHPTNTTTCVNNEGLKIPGLWLSQQPRGDIPDVCLLQLVVLSIVGIDADIIEGRHHPVEVEAHQDEAVDHPLVVAAVPVEVSYGNPDLGVDVNLHSSPFCSVFLL